MSAEEQKILDEADILILGTRNASQYSYQKEFGNSLTKKGKKLVVVATCDPYDFLDEPSIKNYLTIYEPTMSAFKAAVAVMFGEAQATGKLQLKLQLFVMCC